MSRLQKLLFVACGVFSGLAGAAEPFFDDPLRTEEALHLRGASLLASRVAERPCADVLPGRPLTAADVVDLALCRQPQTREAWAAARAQAAQLGVARAAWLPTLDARLATSRNTIDGRSSKQQNANLSLSWFLFDGGESSANEDNAAALLDMALANRDSIAQAVFLAALQAYYNAQATQAAVVAAQQNERSAQESLAAAELRYQVGTATPADRLQAQTAASQARLARQRAEGEARNAQGVLANALGFPAATGFTLVAAEPLGEVAAFQRDVDSLIRAALEQRPDLKAAAAQLRAVEASIEAVRAQGRPSVSLNAGPNWQRIEDDRSRGNSVGLVLNVPIFTGFENSYRIRAAQAQREVRLAQNERLQNQVTLDVWQAYQRLQTAAEAVQTTRDLLASAEQSERVALGRYKAGVGTVLDVLNAQSALAAARMQRIQSELDWYVYRAVLAQAMGALDDSLLAAAPERP